VAERFSLEKPRLAIRPEELNPGRMDGHNNLHGKVESINYLGSIVRLKLEMDGTMLWMDMFNEQNLRIPGVGEPYEVHFPESACWLI
jgi:putative spermidine/putrescine transport system ATP-binding protein